MAELAKGRMRAKLPLLEQALTGLMRDHHRRRLTLQLAHIDFLDEQIDTLSLEITRGLGEVPAEARPSPNLARTMGEEGSAGVGMLLALLCLLRRPLPCWIPSQG